MIIAINIVSAIFQALLIFQLSSVFGTKKAIKPYILPIIILVYASFSVVSNEVIPIKYICTILDVIMWVGCSYIYKMNIFKRLIGIALTYVLLMLAEMAIGIIISGVYNIPVVEVQDNAIFYLEGMLISKAIVFTIITVIKPFFQDKNESTRKIIYLPFILIMVVSFYIIYLLSNYAYKTTLPFVKVSVVVGAILLIASSVSILFVLEYILKQEKDKRNATLRLSQIENEKKYYASLLEKQIHSAKEIHELENKMFVIRDLLLVNFEKGFNKINDICGIVGEPTKMKYTGLESLDALLFSKFQKIEEEQIALKIEIFTLEKIEIDEIDLCVIIGNLLDNSIEACCKIEEKEKRAISIKINQKSDYLNMFLDNTCDLSTITNEGFKTSKKNKEIHGFGLVNIQEMLRNYFGSIEKGLIDENFVVSVVMRNKFPSANTSKIQSSLDKV